MAAPGANYLYGTQMNKGYVSSTAFLDQREILNKILDVTNEESSFLDIMELTGKSMVTAVPTYHHFVNSELFVVGTVGSTPAVSGSGTTTATFNLDATAWAYAQVGDLLLLKDGLVGYISAKSAVPYSATTSTITVKSVDQSNLTVVAADKISFLSNAAGEGSLSPDARRWGVTKFVNQVQTFKAKFQITDIQKASKVEVDYNGKPFFMYKGQHESLTKFRADISNALMFGRVSASTAFGSFNNSFAAGVATVNNLYTGNTLTGYANGFPNGGSGQDGIAPTLVDSEGNPVSTTMGLDQYCSLYGVTSTDSVATFALANLQGLTRALNKLRAPLDYLMFVGTEGNIRIDDILNGTGTSSAVLNVTNKILQGDKKNLDLGIDSFKIYGRTFGKKYLPILDHPMITNTGAGHNYEKSIYGIPMGKQKTVDNQMLDRVQVRYMANDGTDLKYREILLGGLAPVPTNERSVLEIHYQSTQGLHVLGANHLFRIRG